MRAKGDASEDTPVLMDSERLARTQPVQVVPLPPAQMYRTLREQVLNPADVVHRPFALGQGNAAEVQVVFQLLVGPVLGLRLLADLHESRLGPPPLPEDEPESHHRH